MLMMWLRGPVRAALRVWRQCSPNRDQPVHPDLVEGLFSGAGGG
jgi:hypothetical protein